ncbi:hypothetical protein B0H66DRAFT_470123 [Apodospora peruviana]|uniref:C2H2-type domain-containing protein n=1 Tax=Apodospora peruviana TaxID=516989 RepID=A0AAE0MBL1_9PEZI|nr:hypothetical protein B0H66DRAFT_470123 [Apodospora peruviana]
MSGVGLEVLLEGLIPEIAYSGEKGVSINSLLKIVRQYHNTLDVQESSPEGENGATTRDGQGPAHHDNLEASFSDAEMTSARWAWDWLRSRPQILINGNKRWNRLELSQVLALPEAETDDSQQAETNTCDAPAPPPKKAKEPKSKKALTVRPRIHPSEDLVWQTLTRHGVDYKRVPVLEWKCLLGIASVRGEGILQSDLRRLVDQDKRSLPKRTDSLARKGYIAKRTIVVSRMKTSKLWLIDFAPPILETEKTGGLDLSPETLSKDLEPVAWHERWTGNDIDMEAFGRTFVGIIKAWGVIRYSDLRYKMGVGGKHWQMKTLAKNSQRFVDMGVLKYTAAAFAGSRKVFKDCLKFIRDPRPEEWDKFLATGKKTSQYSDPTRHREPKPNALALYGESVQTTEEGGARQKTPRIFPGWSPEKPIAQNVFEVIQSAGPEGASNPQVSVATVGYGFRRYMASHLNKVAETTQPPHLKRFQVTSRLVRKGKTSAYMFSITHPESSTEEGAADPVNHDNSSSSTSGNAYGFGAIRPRAFAEKQQMSLTHLSHLARKPGSLAKRKDRFRGRLERMRQNGTPDESATSTLEATPEVTTEILGQAEAGPVVEEAITEKSQKVEETAPEREPGVYFGAPGSLNPRPKKGRPSKSLVVIIRSDKLKDPSSIGLSQLLEQGEPCNQEESKEAESTGLAPDATQDDIEVAVGEPASLEEVLEVEEMPPSPPPFSGRGRGRGHGRGRGGRGRGGGTTRGGKRKGASAGGMYKCDTCGNVWKNDIGLKYHQTKAQTPCNPNFDPAALLGLSRKRRKMSPVPPTPSVASAASVVASDDEDAGPSSRPRQSRRATRKVHKTVTAIPTGARVRPRMRNAMRSVQDPSLVFRGLAFADIDDTLDDLPREMDLRGRKSQPARRPSVSILSGAPDDITHGNDAMEIDGDAGTALPNATVQPPGEMDVDEPSVAVDDADRLNKNQHDGDSAIVLPPTNYDFMATEAKKKTAQAYDIINYLLDNNCGVFPGDRALFYALLRVFLKEFPRQHPPTWKSYHSAVKALEGRNQARVHTHMLRTETGRMATLSLVLRVGTDPTGRVPTFMKQKMRDTYPKLYIPPAFSPTEEELALLQENDTGKPAAAQKEYKPNANGEKFRSRRRIDDVEVFNAPYYTQTANDNATEFRDPFCPKEKGPRGQKRLAPLDEDLGNSPKKRLKPVAEKTRLDVKERDSSGATHNLTQPVDLSTPFGAKRRRYKQRTSNAASRKPNTQFDEGSLDPGILNGEPPSVIEAIKAYGLLPAKPGKRGRPRLPLKPKKMGKLPVQLGRAQNPGLASLPGAFYKYFLPGPSSTEPPFAVRFLEPNTQLDESEFEENQDHEKDEVSTPYRFETAEATATNVSGDGDHECDHQIGRPKEYSFVPAITIDEIGLDTWPSLDYADFEHHTKSSFSVHGSMPTRHFFLSQHVPTSAEEMALLARGHNFYLETWVDQDWGKFWSLIQRCLTWELSTVGSYVLQGVSLSPKYVHINVSPSRSKSNMRNVNLKWSEERQFTLETLPYEDLDDIVGDDDFLQYDNHTQSGTAEPRRPKKRRIMRTIPTKRIGVGGRPTKFKLQAIKTGRELTAYPTSAGDFLRQPGEQSEDLDWTSENTKLTAFIVVSTLLGGVDRVVDWGLMMRLFPDMTISQLRHTWCALRKDRQSTIVTLTDKFRTAFLKAYSANELPPIDFNDTAAYDWKALVKWTANLDGFERVSLPASRKMLGENFALLNCRFENREWRESFYHVQRSVFNKFQDACSEPLAFPAERDTGRSTPDLNLAVAMSWTRSLCVTPVDMYPNEEVLKKRNSLLPGMSKSEIMEVILQGIDQLQREGIISKSTAKWSNGRWWRFNSRVPELLDKISHGERISKAVAFKTELDRAFRAGEKKRVTYITNDGMIMALLNMQAHGRIRVETTGQPNVPMGHEPGNYETRKYTKKYLHFRLDIAPTVRYLHDDSSEITALRKRVGSAKPPTRGPGGATPAWCDVFEKVDVNRWLKYLSVVLVTIASRGAMPADELVKTVKPVAMLFEVELIMEWGRELGILKSQVDGATSLAAMEWWWLVIDAQRKGLQDAAAATAAAAAAPPRSRRPLPSARRRTGADGSSEDVEAAAKGWLYRAGSACCGSVSKQDVAV